MKIDPTTLALFSPFTREVANPKRQLIKSQKQFERFVDFNNGVKDCYCDLFTYPFDGVIDKMYFDFDWWVGFKRALPFAQRFYKFLTECEGLNVIPVASGVKGFNLYPILKPETYDPIMAKKMLYEKQYSLIIKEFACSKIVKISSTTVFDKDGKEHPMLVNRKGLIYLDPKPIGDIRRFVRIPNTLRPPKNLTYCTYLDSETFLDMDAKDVAKCIRKPQTFDLSDMFSATKGLSDIETVPDLYKKLGSSNGRPLGVHLTKLTPTKANKFLMPLLRPCLYDHMMTAEPRHSARVASTVDLLQAGLSPDTILGVYRKLGWNDFNENVTKYQINNVVYLKPFGCRKLIEEGLATRKCEECKAYTEFDGGVVAGS